VRDHVTQTSGAREVDIDVHRVVVAGGAAVHRELLAGDGRQGQRRNFIADTKAVEGGVRHRNPPQP